MYGICRNLYSLMHLSKSIWWEEVGWGGVGVASKAQEFELKAFFWGGGVNALPQRHHISSKGNKCPTP